MFAAEIRLTMKSRKVLVFFVLLSLLTVFSCANRPTRAMRKANRMMEQQAARAQKDYEKAKEKYEKSG